MTIRKLPKKKPAAREDAKPDRTLSITISFDSGGLPLETTNTILASLGAMVKQATAPTRSLKIAEDALRTIANFDNLHMEPSAITMRTTAQATLEELHKLAASTTAADVDGRSHTATDGGKRRRPSPTKTAVRRRRDAKP